MKLVSWLAVLFAACACACAQAQPSSNASIERLHAAAARGDSLVVAALLEHGAPIDGRNARGETALLAAVASGHDLVADMLIQRGANINAQAQNKDTPWLLAGALGRTAMLALMLERNPDYNLRNRYGGSALIPACHYGHPDTVRLLTKRSRINVDQVNDLGWTCLLEAILLGDGGAKHVEIVQVVLEAGANPNLADKDGVTPMSHARRRGQSAIVELLRAAGGR